MTYTTGRHVVELTLHTTVHNADTVTVTYTGTAVQDPAGNLRPRCTGPGRDERHGQRRARHGPRPLGPADGVKVTTATPTLTGSFSDPDPGNTGTIDFRVCGNATCSAAGDPIDAFSSPSGVANGASGSAQIPSGLADGTYYWSARATDNTNAHSSYTLARSITIDTVAPTNVFSLVGVSTAGGFPVAFYPGSGSTVYYNGSAGVGAKTFTIEATVTDATTGGASITTQGFANGGSNLQSHRRDHDDPGQRHVRHERLRLHAAHDRQRRGRRVHDRRRRQPELDDELHAPERQPRADSCVAFPSASVYDAAGWTGTLSGTPPTVAPA